MKLKKKYGQNFLNDGFYVDKIRDFVKLYKGRNMFEIGPGSGALTRVLLENGEYVDAVEIDEELKPALISLKKKFNRLNVTFGDALKIPFDRLLTQPGRYIVFANIPYYITTEIIESLVLNKERFEQAFLTIQQEAAERICAPAGARASGAISFFVEYHAWRKLLFKIPRTAFTPVPKVDSAFICLSFRDRPPIETPYHKIEPIVKTAFKQRRKTLKNSLKELFKDPETILKKAGLSVNSRPESLSLRDFEKIFLMSLE